jgi:hypothetical protein
MSARTLATVTVGTGGSQRRGDEPDQGQHRGEGEPHARHDERRRPRRQRERSSTNVA